MPKTKGDTSVTNVLNIFSFLCSWGWDHFILFMVLKPQLNQLPNQLVTRNCPELWPSPTNLRLWCVCFFAVLNQYRWVMGLPVHLQRRAKGHAPQKWIADVPPHPVPPTVPKRTWPSPIALDRLLAILIPSSSSSNGPTIIHEVNNQCRKNSIFVKKNSQNT